MREDTFKGCWHAAIATALGVAAAYNGMRWLATGRSRNACNLTLYTGMCAYEWYQVHSHWGEQH